MSDRVAVVGAGSWGTAVAGLVGASHPVSLWARSPELASSITRARENATYLPGIALPDGLSATASLEEALEGAGVVFMAVPSHGFRAVLDGPATVRCRSRGDRQPVQGNRERHQSPDVRGGGTGPAGDARPAS